MEEKISISLQEYNELKRKAEAYDQIKEVRSKANSISGKASAAKLTPEQRRERAKKAVAARIAKYGQKTRE